MLNIVAGGITFSTASPEPVTSVTCSDDFTLTGPRGDAVYQSPSVVTLSCHLSPEISAVDMEIWWFKGTACVCLYKNSQVTEGRGYEGRVGLLTHELQTGNVSLQIRDCKASDKGDYLCQVTNGDTTEECSIRVMEGRVSQSVFRLPLTIPLLTNSVS
ncbi:hypothetical protein NFI96_003921 [Prochilodus magdalenae]|nr:hypothetical protein NFI96_003921 [Prochilodus magdalenae]